MSDQDAQPPAVAAEESKLINAAIVIQRRMRGILARKRARARKRQLEVLKVEATGEGSVLQRLEVRAAIKIQARARGMLQRKRMREKARALEPGAPQEDKGERPGEKSDVKALKSKSAVGGDSPVASGKNAKAAAKPTAGKDQKKLPADGKAAVVPSAAAAAAAAAAPAKDVLNDQDLKIKRALEKELDALKVDQMRLKVQMENQKKRLETESQLRLEATARAEAAEEELRYFNTRPSAKSRSHDDDVAKSKGLLAAAEERFMIAEGMQSRLQARIELLEKDLADERRRNSAAAAG